VLRAAANDAAQATQDAMKGAAQATKNTVYALIHLPSTVRRCKRSRCLDY
jgi:hypothetical protein